MRAPVPTTSVGVPVHQYGAALPDTPCAPPPAVDQGLDEWDPFFCITAPTQILAPGDPGFNSVQHQFSTGSPLPLAHDYEFDADQFLKDATLPSPMASGEDSLLPAAAAAAVDLSTPIPAAAAAAMPANPAAPGTGEAGDTLAPGGLSSGGQSAASRSRRANRGRAARGVSTGARKGKGNKLKRDRLDFTDPEVQAYMRELTKGSRLSQTAVAARLHTRFGGTLYSRSQMCRIFKKFGIPSARR